MFNFSRSLRQSPPFLIKWVNSGNIVHIPVFKIFAFVDIEREHQEFLADPSPHLKIQHDESSICLFYCQKCHFLATIKINDPGFIYLSETAAAPR